MNKIFKIGVLLILVIVISGCGNSSKNDKTPRSSTEIEALEDLIKDGYGVLDDLIWDDWLDETAVIPAVGEYQKKLNRIFESGKVNIRYAFVSDKPLNVRVYTDQSRNSEYPDCGANIILKKKIVCEKINKDFLLVITTFRNEEVELVIKADFNTNIGPGAEQTTTAATIVPKEKPEVPPTPSKEETPEVEEKEKPEEVVENISEEGTPEENIPKEDINETVPLEEPQENNLTEQPLVDETVIEQPVNETIPQPSNETGNNN